MVLDDQQHRARAVEKLARVMEGVGMPHGIAQVYSALTLAPAEGLSTSELVEWLHISRASVSTATQFLVSAELAERYRVRGSREAHYRMVKGSWGPILSRKFAGAFAVRASVEEAMEYTESASARERLEEMRDVYGFFEREFEGTLKRWNERNAS